MTSSHAAFKSGDGATVAIVGAGPSGLAMLKQLREDGFRTTLYERRPAVGGIWAYSENTAYTSVLRSTTPFNSKFVGTPTDFPVPEDVSVYMMPHQIAKYMHDYATHFDLHRDIVLNTSVILVARDEAARQWRLEIEQHPPPTTAGGDAPGTGTGAHTPTPTPSTGFFDKIVLCHGYQNRAVSPTFPGQDLFEGTITHSQAYRRPEPYAGKNVVVLGIRGSAGDILPDLEPHANKLWISHRRGMFPVRRLSKGRPVDLAIHWRIQQIFNALTRYCPGLTQVVGDWAASYIAKRLWERPPDPSWRLLPPPSPTLVLPGPFEHLLPLLHKGRVESLHAIRRFTGPRSIEFDDGTVLDDVDAVILCTGYIADWSIAPFVETSIPTAHGYAGPPIRRLWMNIFPPAYADSAALLCYGVFSRAAGFFFADVMAMSTSNFWRGVLPPGVKALPTRAEMETHVDRHQAWIASRWEMEHAVDVSMVRQWEFQQWQHRWAGTGMDELGLGWGRAGWKLWWNDRELYRMVMDGPGFAHMFRLFETGRRKTWPGARAEIVKQNAAIAKLFPLKPGQDERHIWGDGSPSPKGLDG